MFLKMLQYQKRKKVFIRQCVVGTLSIIFQLTSAVFCTNILKITITFCTASSSSTPDGDPQPERFLPGRSLPRGSGGATSTLHPLPLWPLPSPAVVAAPFSSSGGGDGEVLPDGFSRELGRRSWGHRATWWSLAEA
jgi:hypothetical protein